MDLHYRWFLICLWIAAVTFILGIVQIIFVGATDEFWVFLICFLCSFGWVILEYTILSRKEVKREIEKTKDWKRDRSHFPIIGPPEFCTSVNRVLNELEAKTPDRYREVLEYLPKAEYKSRLSHNGHYVSGRSDGYFSVDGTGNIKVNSHQYKRNTYRDFRWIFLHEVGHNVRWIRDNDIREGAANNYANMVIKELL